MAKSKVEAVRAFLKSTDKTLVCTHATFRFAVEELGIEAFDNRLIAIDEFHHVCSGLMKPDTHLGENACQIEVSDDQTTPFLFC